MTDTTPMILDDQNTPVRTLTLNRPEARNALSLEMMSALTHAIQQAGQDPAVRALVIAANGPAFCAGHDLAELTAMRDAGDQGKAAYDQVFKQCADLMKAIIACPVPVIAQVHAMATAAGCQLVATCDLAIAATEARFATPGVNIGLFCSTPMVALSRNVSAKQAMEMLLTGDAISAETAQDIGLINRVVGADQLIEATQGLAHQIAAKPRATVVLGKEAFYRQLSMPVVEAYEFTAQVMATNMLAAEAEEGIEAFLEKREPRWP